MRKETDASARKRTRHHRSPGTKPPPPAPPLAPTVPVPIRADCADAGAEEVEERGVGLRERHREAVAWRRSADRIAGGESPELDAAARCGGRSIAILSWFERVGGVIGDRVEVGPWAHILIEPHFWAQ